MVWTSEKKQLSKVFENALQVSSRPKLVSTKFALPLLANPERQKWA